MKKIIFLFSLMLSTGAFAISDAKLIKKCEETGAMKLQAQAQAQNCTIEAESLKVEDIDNRLLNPSKYVWYSILANCNGQDGKIQTLVQYDSFSRKCL